MALSGLGFLIGTIGLGIVLVRNVQDRKRELALMLAVGYSKRQLFRLVFTENLYLLAAGWGIGMLAALMGILPSLFSPSFDLQGGFTFVVIRDPIMVCCDILHYDRQWETIDMGVEE
jgi:ABC-type antimicrobial peptide transport system permease subunit